MTKKTLILIIPLMLMLLLSAVAFIPIGSNYSRIQVQSGRLGGLLRAHDQFRDLKTEPCFRKFTGVIITGVLPEDVEVRIWDSTAELRYLVLPERPAGTEEVE